MGVLVAQVLVALCALVAAVSSAPFYTLNAGLPMTYSAAMPLTYSASLPWAIQPEITKYSVKPIEKEVRTITHDRVPLEIVVCCCSDIKITV